MLITRTAKWLLAWGAMVMLSPLAGAQVPANANLNYQTSTPTYEHGSAPFAQDFAHPKHLDPPNIELPAQPFAPAETSTYGNGPRPHIGWFASYERVFWSLSKPSRQLIGSPTAAPPDTNTFITPFFVPFPALNTVDTGKLTANGAWGNRWEIGYVDDDNYGFLVSVLDHVSQGQNHLDNNVQMQFDDPGHLLDGTVLVDGFALDVGKMVVQFDTFAMKNLVHINGVELLRTYRAPRLHHGGFFELMYGVRWLQIDDTFSVIGNNQLDVFTNPYINPLGNSQWSMRASNNMVGPEIGGRLFRQRGRWVTSVEGRFMAAANFQNVTQKTNLGDQVAFVNEAFDGTEGVVIPRRFYGIGANNHFFTTTFAPVGELRVNLSYQVTRSVGLKVGYTGMIVGNVSRASNRFTYNTAELINILPSGTHQVFFANGINFGVEVNR